MNNSGGCITCAKTLIGKQHSKPIIIDSVEYPSLTFAAKHFGLNRGAVHARLKKGWSVDKAFKTPLKTNSVNVDGINYRGIKGASEKYGMPYKTVHQRVKKLGWDLERALTTPIQKRTN